MVVVVNKWNHKNYNWSKEGRGNNRVYLDPMSIRVSVLLITHTTYITLMLQTLLVKLIPVLFYDYKWFQFSWHKINNYNFSNIKYEMYKILIFLCVVVHCNNSLKEHGSHLYIYFSPLTFLLNTFKKNY